VDEQTKEAIVGSLQTLGMLLVGAALLAFSVAALFKFGSRIGVWFSQLADENRKLYWAAIGLACWTAVIAAGAGVVAYLFYLALFLEGPLTLWERAGLASVALSIAAGIVYRFASLPWDVLVRVVGALRTLRELKDLTPEGREESLGAWFRGDPIPTERVARFIARRHGFPEGLMPYAGAREDEAPAVEGDETSGKEIESST
jgi:hypothetical protein